MSLSSDLISQFVKTTKPSKTPPSESTVHGTTVEYNGGTYVKLDGSDLLTPVSTTADAKPGERVTVLIKNHTATVTGNMSSPSARTGDVQEIGNKITEVEILIADKVSTKQLEAESARIDELVAGNVTIKGRLDAAEASIDTLEANNVTINGKLTAAEASIENLQATKIDAEIVEAKYATIENLEATNLKVNNLESTYGSFKNLATEKFTAIEADINTLNTTKLSAEQADLKYANIDFANIGNAAIEAFYAKSGIIKDLVIGDQTVTGKLVGVTIVGDLIEGGTVKADKLVVLGEDGLYYKLNTNGVSITAEQTEYNSLNGSIITANTITAEKINVDDLVAFDATIGGFKIGSDSIYSGVKSSASNTTQGIYLDSTGQFVVGDETNYLKYYKDENGAYILDISSVTDLQNDIDNVHTEITNQRTGILSDSRSIVLSALEEYTKVDDFNEYKESTEAQLQVMSDNISMNFSNVTESIGDVDTDMNTRFSELEKYIRFDADGISIGASDNQLKLVLDNDNIVFTKNDQPIGWWDGVDFHTGNIVVEVNERAQFGNFAFIPRSDGSLMFLKVSGEES